MKDVPLLVLKVFSRSINKSGVSNSVSLTFIQKALSFNWRGFNWNFTKYFVYTVLCTYTNFCPFEHCVLHITCSMLHIRYITLYNINTLHRIHNVQTDKKYV